MSCMPLQPTYSGAIPTGVTQWRTVCSTVTLQALTKSLTIPRSPLVIDSRLALDLVLLLSSCHRVVLFFLIWQQDVGEFRDMLSTQLGLLSIKKDAIHVLPSSGFPPQSSGKLPICPCCKSHD
jgi:hypothetical protein